MIGTINRDITSHRKADLELETYRHTLEAMVERRTDELQREIQERQQMEEALVEVNAALARANTDLGESEERYRLLVTQSPVSIMVIQQNHFVFVNPAGASRLAYQDANQMVGRRVLDVVAPGSRARMAEWMQRMDTAETKEPVLVEFQSREGQTFLFESSSVPIVYQGKPAALVIGQDITERMRYEQQLEASLSEKEVMLREIHHRVKNNLNVIIALIDLQKSKQTDPQVLQLFKDLQTRAYSMSLVHESLYRSPNLAQVDFSGYLHTLIEHLYAAYQTTSNHVGVRVEVENIALRIESAIPCGLIVNELVTNALKYAFPPAFTPPGGQSKQILIRLEQSQDAEDRPLCLTVQDNGVGLPPGLDWHSIPTLGLQLVQVLAQQLDGQIRVENAGGVAWQIRFKQRR